jgi:general secretion pathway protein E
MSGLNIAENRLPQDGRTSIFINKERRDIRVSTIPSMNGERMVLRLLRSSKNLKNINQLGLSNNHLNKLIYILNSSNGLILVTGPTGTGKTTTLYAALAYINQKNINIMTMEDPIEYNLSGISQTQVNNKINLNFVNGLRAFLRQDPDVIMVGEIRDKETAQIATNASLTGHLVLSTIHTTDSSGTVTRLINMDIDPFLISNSLLAIITQRLVRVICNNCKIKYMPNLHEIATIDKEQMKNINANINMSGSLLNIQKYVNIAKNESILDDGLKKIFSGITTIDEISRVSKIEE